MRRGVGIRLAVLLFGLLLTASAAADARTDFLVRMLSTSTQFRVRLQAALALGQQSAGREVVQALSQGLRDGHPSVRSASASALGRLKASSALPALRNAQRDRDADVRRAVDQAIAALNPSSSGSRVASASSSSSSSAQPNVPSGPASYYVGVGKPGDRAGGSGADLARLREHLVRTVAGMDGVLVAPSSESESAARGVLRQRNLVGFYVDGSITKVEVRSDGAVRAEVSIVVGTYPGRSIKAMLTGAATVPGGGTSPAARKQAIEGAFTGALRRLPQAMRTGALAQGG